MRRARLVLMIVLVVQAAVGGVAGAAQAATSQPAAAASAVPATPGCNNYFHLGLFGGEVRGRLCEDTSGVVVAVEGYAEDTMTDGLCFQYIGRWHDGRGELLREDHARACDPAGTRTPFDWKAPAGAVYYIHDFDLVVP